MTREDIENLLDELCERVVADTRDDAAKRSIMLDVLGHLEKLGWFLRDPKVSSVVVGRHAEPERDGYERILITCGLPSPHFQYAKVDFSFDRTIADEDYRIILTHKIRLDDVDRTQPATVKLSACLLLQGWATRPSDRGNFTMELWIIPYDRDYWSIEETLTREARPSRANKRSRSQNSRLVDYDTFDDDSLSKGGWY